jgi:mannose-6-phosphate isomerase-like protein (cupin superfamily)
MPVFECGAVRSPAGPTRRAATLESRPWCDVEYVEIASLEAEERIAVERRRERERLVVVDGVASVAAGEEETVAADSGTMVELDGESGAFRVVADEETTLVRCCGEWADPSGGAGAFTVECDPGAEDDGDAVDYPKETAFDAHYHDCDEYFVVTEGRGVLVTERRFYEVSPGDVVAVGMGHHHDVPQVLDGPLRGVWCETTLEGEGRRGHLYDHTHGAPTPKSERV